MDDRGMSVSVDRIATDAGTMPAGNARGSSGLLDAALSIVSEDGLGGLTLRPLARRMGCSVAALGRRVGTKDELLDRLIGLAAEADAAQIAPWQRLIEAAPPLPPQSLAEITEEVLRARTGSGRLRTQFKCELVDAAAFHPRLRPALRKWFAIERSFWTALAEKSTLVADFDMADALEAFAVDDAARALTIGECDDYHWLRRESIRRLWNGLFAADPPAANPLFDDALRPKGGPEDLPVWTARMLTSARDRTFGQIAALIILDSGMDAITHREVARRANMPHTSIAYHYPTQEDLVELGINAIVETMEQGARASMASGELPAEAGTFALASYAISLAAARRPGLQPIVRELRRRRGENLIAWLRVSLPQNPRIDIANVQALASAVMGAIVLSRAGLKDSAPLTRRMFAQLGHWPDLLARFGA